MILNLNLVSSLFSSTVRRQLIWSVAVVHAVMMSLFVYDLSLRQSEFLIQSQVDQAASLAQNLSLISATPLLSSDLSGLQELTLAISRYPGVVHAMVTTLDGKILAHGDQSLRGKYASDLPTFKVTPASLPQELYRGLQLADVVAPVWVNQKQIGWVRLGVSQSATASRLAAITQSGFLYTTLAIVIGVVLAWLLANRLTRRLHQLVQVADAVSAGNIHNRAVVNGQDELQRLAKALNYMLDVLASRTQEELRLRAALQTEKELAEITLASIGDAVITTDVNDAVTFINSAASALLGWDRNEVYGRHVTDILKIMGASESLTHGTSLRLGFATGTRALSEVTCSLITRSGQICQVESSASPISSPEGVLIGSVLVVRDISEKYLAQDKLQWQAGHDALTGLPNRALLADRFDRAIDWSKRNNTKLAICFLDLDNFKPVNDAYGHDVGDKLLMEVVARLNQQLREVDTLSRLGGDEFVILLEGLDDVDNLPVLMSRILQTVSEPFHLNGLNASVTASIGLTVYPSDNSDADTLLRHADQAMYVAKQTGRNRYHLFDVQQDQERESTQQTLERVRYALGVNEFVLFYQPKVNLRTGSVEGFEALLRWQHPQDGLIPPLSFLPMVEQSDLIIDIGEWVIEKALQQLSRWQVNGKMLPISVNIAARHFQKSDFLERLQEILARYPQISPSFLEFEILESVALGDIRAMNTLIANCRTLGIRFSLDDFGTGYSSLSYLKRIPVQTLKVDQSFVRDMLTDRDDLALVESVIKIAKLFRLEVVAEGVETYEQGMLLLRLGCDMVQGYGIARPMSADQCMGWVEQYRPDAQWT